MKFDIRNTFFAASSLLLVVIQPVFAETQTSKQTLQSAIISGFSTELRSTSLKQNHPNSSVIGLQVIQQFNPKIAFGVLTYGTAFETRDESLFRLASGGLVQMKIRERLNFKGGLNIFQQSYKGETTLNQKGTAWSLGWVRDFEIIPGLDFFLSGSYWFWGMNEKKSSLSEFLRAYSENQSAMLNFALQFHW